MQSKKIPFNVWLSVCALGLGGMTSTMAAYTPFTYMAMFQDASGYTSSQIAMLMSIVSVLSFFLYAPGGAFVDKFDVKKITVLSFLASGILGFAAMMLPTYSVMVVIYVFIGIFVNVLAQASLMKAVRMCGSDEQQSKINAVKGIATQLILFVVSMAVVAVVAKVSSSVLGYRLLVGIYSILTVLCAVVLIFAYKPNREEKHENEALNEDAPKQSILDGFKVFKYLIVITVSVSGFAAYTVFNTTLTYLQTFLTAYFGMSVATATTLATIKQYATPLLVLPLVSYIVTKTQKTSFSSGSMIAVCSFIASVGMIATCFITEDFSNIAILIGLYMLIAVASGGALNQNMITFFDAHISEGMTGAIIGAYSLVAYAGDMFLYNICGAWIDNLGFDGYIRVFILSAVFAVVGMVAGIISHKYVKDIRSGKIEPIK